jgi:hypothetical protein
VGFLSFICKKYRYPALRIAYIDEKEVQLRNGKIEKQYYSVLVKGDDEVLSLCCMNLNLYLPSVHIRNYNSFLHLALTRFLAHVGPVGHVTILTS